MFEEVVPAIAAALSAQGSELVIAGGKSALRSLYEGIKARFGQGTPEGESLEAVVLDPDDDGRVEEFARHLAAAMAQDPEFAERTLAAWRDVTVSESAVVNNFSGEAHQVVQARDIHGGVRF